MKRFLKTASLVLLLAAMLSFGGGARPSLAVCSNTTNADNALACACDAQVINTDHEPSVCSVDASKDPITGPDGIIKKVTIILAVVAGIVAVVLILLGGIRFALSDGDAQKTANARQMVIGAVIGLGIIAVSSTAVIFVVSKL